LFTGFKHVVRLGCFSHKGFTGNVVKELSTSVGGFAENALQQSILGTTSIGFIVPLP
jgi:hypothetical protein